MCVQDFLSALKTANGGEIAELIRRGMNTRLLDAAEEGRLEGVKAAVCAGADLSAADEVSCVMLIVYYWFCLMLDNYFSQRGWTALSRAASKGRLDVVQYLVDAGACLEIVDEVS